MSDHKHDKNEPSNASRREMLKRVGAAGAVGAVAATATVVTTDAIKPAHAQANAPLREALETLKIGRAHV